MTDSMPSQQSSDAGDFLPLVRTLLRGFRAVDQVASEALASAGFVGSGPAAWYLLHSIPEDGGRASRLARELGVSKQAVGQSLDELQKEGYVTRERDPRDRRALTVRRTDRGEAIVAAGEAALLEQERAWGQVLGRTRLRALRATMEEFTEFLQDGTV